MLIVPFHFESNRIVSVSLYVFVTFDVFWLHLSSFGAFLASIGRIVAYLCTYVLPSAYFGVFWIFVRNGREWPIGACSGQTLCCLADGYMHR